MHAEHYGFSVEPVDGAANAKHTIVAKPHGMKDAPAAADGTIQTVNSKLAIIGEFVQDQLAQVKNLKQSMGSEEVKVDLEKWLTNILDQLKEQSGKADA